MPRNYKKIIAWQHSHQLTLEIHGCTKTFPSDEHFGLVSQLRRAAYSVPANIVEGSGRETHRDYLRFLINALASLKETEYFLLLASDLKYLGNAEYDRLNELITVTMRTLQGLIKAVKREVNSSGLQTMDYSPRTTDQLP